MQKGRGLAHLITLCRNTTQRSKTWFYLIIHSPFTIIRTRSNIAPFHYAEKRSTCNHSSIMHRILIIHIRKTLRNYLVTFNHSYHIIQITSINHRDKNCKIIDHIADKENITFPATYLSYYFYGLKYIFKTHSFDGQSHTKPRKQNSPQNSSTKT